jgi:signal transduction histidine kinase
MIKTALRNLLSNAIKFTNPLGKIEIKCSTSGNFAHIQVTDTGIGIEEEMLKKLFIIEEKFSTEGTGQEKGTGLGLILCKELVEKNEGTLSVNSRKGVGTVFQFSIPLSIISTC